MLAPRALLKTSHGLASARARSGRVRNFAATAYLTSDEMPRFAGPQTFMRLPAAKSAKDLDVCFAGVPFDIATSNRSGTRLGPRQLRSESAMLRPYHFAHGAEPFETLRVADIGDVATNPYSLPKSIAAMEKFYDEVVSTHGCRPLTMGGDHTIVLPILRAMKKKYGPVALVHVDAHADFTPEMSGERITHGTPFYRAVEEGLLDTEKVAQIGIRTGYAPDDWDKARKLGFRIVPSHECWHKSLEGLMEEVRAQIGDTPTYLSFDIDALDCAVASGTGTPEPAGLTTIQGFEVVRGCRGLNLVGGDLVEVSPPYDQQGNTAVIGGNLLYEMLCVMPGVRYRPMMTPVKREGWTWGQTY